VEAETGELRLGGVRRGQDAQRPVQRAAAGRAEGVQIEGGDTVDGGVEAASGKVGRLAQPDAWSGLPAGQLRRTEAVVVEEEVLQRVLDPTPTALEMGAAVRRRALVAWSSASGRHCSESRMRTASSLLTPAAARSQQRCRARSAGPEHLSDAVVSWSEADQRRPGLLTGA